MLALCLAIAFQDVSVGPEIPDARRARKPSLVEIDETGIAFSSIWHAEGRYMAFNAPEPDQGGNDLNGDGDANDWVLHVLDIVTGKTTNLGVDHFYGFGEEGMLVADQLTYRVFEQELGSDLNGDGYLDDLTSFVYDARIGELHASDAIGRAYVNGGSRAAFTIWEGATDTDINGDGDTLDLVYHDWDLSTGEMRNLGIAVRGPIVPSGDSFLLLAKAGGGKEILQVYEPATDTLIDTGLALAMPPVAADGLVAFLVDEAHHGNTDLNGDGDQADEVLFVYDTASGELRNLAAAVRRPRFTSLYNVIESVELRVARDRVAYVVSEYHQGMTDLNGDGDHFDSVMFAHTFSTNETINFEIATFHYTLGEDILAFELDETAQGGDFSGNFNPRDFVLFVHDFRTGNTTNTGLPVSVIIPEEIVFGVSSAGVAFTANELSDLADMNGDGDRDDNVYHFYDASSGAIENLGLAGFMGTEDFPEGVLGRNAFYFLVWENSQGVDLDGDGDLNGRVLFAMNTRSGRVLNTGMAGFLYGLSVGNHLAFISAESALGTDLNGDGDTADRVLRSARIRP